MNTAVAEKTTVTVEDCFHGMNQGDAPVAFAVVAASRARSK
jgi:hypothetical protein